MLMEECRSCSNVMTKCMRFLGTNNLSSIIRPNLVDKLSAYCLYSLGIWLIVCLDCF